MKALHPYITFSGQCRQALKFYKECFAGEIITMRTFRDSPDEVADEFKNNIMHAEFKAEGIYFMASDAMPDDKVSIGNQISLSIQFTDKEEQMKIFNFLSSNGSITIPLKNTFWGARFGTLTDQFGINWMLNCQN